MKILKDPIRLEIESGEECGDILEYLAHIFRTGHRKDHVVGWAIYLSDYFHCGWDDDPVVDTALRSVLEWREYYESEANKS